MFCIDDKSPTIWCFILVLCWVGLFPTHSQGALVTINYQGVINAGGVVDGPSNGDFETFVGETVQFSITYEADPLLSPNHNSGGDRHYHGTYPIEESRRVFSGHPE